MVTILNTTPLFVRQAAKDLGLFADDLSVYERDARSGNKVFTLVYDQGDRQFPDRIFTDMPLWSKKGSIRLSLEKAVAAKKFLESKGVEILMDQPGKWDEEAGEYSKGRRSVAQTIRYLAELGELFPVDASCHGMTLMYFLSEEEDAGEAQKKILTKNAGLYASQLQRTFKRLGVDASIQVPEISPSSEWSEIWANIWEQVNAQLGS